MSSLALLKIQRNFTVTWSAGGDISATLDLRTYKRAYVMNLEITSIPITDVAAEPCGAMI